MTDQIPATHQGTNAVADVLQQHLPHNNRPAALRLASECIDAWLLASNPVGEPETIYDEYYRLREAAFAVVMNWDMESTQHGSMPALRIALGLPPERPTREEAVERFLRGGYQPPVIDQSDAR